MNDTPNQKAYDPERSNKKKRIALLILIGVEVAALTAGLLYYFLGYNKGNETTTYGLKDAAESLTLIKSHQQSGWTLPKNHLEAREAVNDGKNTSTRRVSYTASPFALSLVSTKNGVESSKVYSYDAGVYSLDTTSGGQTVRTTIAEADITKSVIPSAYSTYNSIDRQATLQSQIDLLLDLYAGTTSSSVPASSSVLSSSSSASSSSSSSSSVSSNGSSAASVSSVSTASVPTAYAITTYEYSGDKKGNLNISLTGILSLEAAPVTSFHLVYSNYILKSYSRTVQNAGFPYGEAFSYDVVD
jgi:flagellar basal body-associated protein FliL